jgi:hypothetical protein
MKRDLHRVLIVSICFFGGVLPTQAQDHIAQPAPIQEFSTPEPVIETIARCLSLGKEIIMNPDAQCVQYEKGGSVLGNARIPLNETGAICQNENDPRRLSPDVVKRVAAQKAHAIAPTGIRILGGVFCKGLDLVGLSLTYSLVLDRSFFNGPVTARNFQTTNDLSLDNSILMGSLGLTRAAIGGSIYSSAGFVRALTVSDTKVGGSWHFNNAAILDDARISQLSITGDFLLNGSAFSWFWLQSSRVGGALELNNTEARCAYHIKASTIGYVTANETGFGSIETTQPNASGPPIDYSWWHRKFTNGPGNAAVQELFASPAIKNVLVDELKEIRSATAAKTDSHAAVYGCYKKSSATNLKPPTDLEFLIADSTIQTTLCITSFEWPTPDGRIPDESQPSTIIGLRETKVGGSLILRPWIGGANTSHFTPNVSKSGKKVLEAIGVSADLFVFNFSQDSNSYSKYLDELDFARIENNAAECDQKNEELLGGAIIPEGQPSIKDALRWLDLKVTDSSQPLTAFINAFEKAGSDATDLRVERARLDLLKRTKPFLDSLDRVSQSLFERFSLGHDPSDYALRSNDAGSTSTASYSLRGSALGVIECGAIAFQWLLWALADSGLRPQKVIIPIIIVILLFWIWCWFKLRIVGFEALDDKKQSSHADGKDKSASTEAEMPGKSTKPDIWPITLLFLFDHLIPAYHIREQHYSFARVYLKLPRKRAKPTPLPANETAVVGGDAASDVTEESNPSYDMPYLWARHQVRPGNHGDYERLERSLVLLRLLGIVLSAFLLAAVNALISK